MSRRLLKNSIFGSISGMAITLSSFLSGLIIARILGVRDTGEVAFAMWVCGLLATLAAMGAPFTATRFVPDLRGQGRTKEADRLAAWLFRPYIAVAAIPALGLLAYGAWIDRSTWPHMLGPVFDSPLICVLVAICCLTQSVSDYVKAYLRGMQEFTRLARWTLVAALAQLSLLAVGSLVFGVAGAIMGYAAGNIVMLPWLRRLAAAQGGVDREIRRRVIRYGAYRWAAEMMALFVWSRVEVAFLGAYGTTTDIGLFTVGLTLVNMAVQGPLMLTWGLLPHFSEILGQNDLARAQRAYASATRILAFMVLPACFGLAAVTPVLLPLLFGAAFKGATGLSMVLIAGAGLTAMSSTGTGVIQATDRSDVDFYTGIAGTVLACIGGFTLVRYFGPFGAAISRTIVQLSVVAMSTWFLTQRMRMTVPTGALLRIGAASAACALAAYGVLMLAPGLPGLVAAIAAGAVVYALGIRLLRPFPPEDMARFVGMAASLPGPALAVGNAVLRLLAFRAEPQPVTEG